MKKQKVDLTLEEELARYIGATFKEYEQKLKKPSPLFEIRGFPFYNGPVLSMGGKYDLSGYEVQTKKVVINPLPLLRLWKRNEEQAKRFIRFMVAHEYFHHIEALKGKIVCVEDDKGLRTTWDTRTDKEDEMREREASQLSGMTFQEWENIYESTWSDVVKYSDRETLKKMRLDEVKSKIRAIESNIAFWTEELTRLKVEQKGLEKEIQRE